MKFKDFYKKFKKEVYNKSIEPTITRDVENRVVNVWMAHQAVETNKKLVWATWFLAVTTIILVIISLFMK